MSESATSSGALGPDHGYGPDIDHVLLSEEQIQAKIGELAAQIATDYAGRAAVSLTTAELLGGDCGILRRAAPDAGRPETQGARRPDGGDAAG